MASTDSPCTLIIKLRILAWIIIDHDKYKIAELEAIFIYHKRDLPPLDFILAMGDPFFT